MVSVWDGRTVQSVTAPDSLVQGHANKLRGVGCTQACEVPEKVLHSSQPVSAIGKMMVRW